MKKTRASLSKQRQELSVKINKWLQMSYESERRLVMTEEDKDLNTRQATFYRQEAAKLKIQLEALARGTARQKNAGFAKGYRSKMKG